MFTLCMSRDDRPAINNTEDRVSHKQVKGGYLLRYRRGFFCPKWSEEWVVLYEDSTLAWYSDKGLGRPKGYVKISEAPELLAVGEWTRQVPRRPKFPHFCNIGQLLAIGSRAKRDVHWLMAQSPAEINDWMTAISNTLPPPPHLPLDDKRLSLTPQQQQDIVTNKRQHLSNGCAARNGCCQDRTASATTASTTTASTTNTTGRKQRTYEADHTVLSGVCIDWGHGWGWGQNAWTVHSLYAHDVAAVTSSVFCHIADDYAVGGIEEADWSAFGDFCF